MGGAEDIFKNLSPIRQRVHAWQLTRRFVMSKEDLDDVVWKRWFEKSFFEVIDKVRTARFPDVSDFFRSRLAKMNVLRRQPDAMRIEKTLRCEPFTRRLLQIKGRPHDRRAGFMADDVNRQPSPDGVREKFQDAGKWLRPRHVRTVNVTLQLRPVPFPVLLPQEVSHVVLAGGQRGGNQPAFHSDGMKQLVVANNRIIEINAEDHGFSRVAAIPRRYFTFNCCINLMLE